MAFSMSPPVVLLLVACVALVAGDNYTLYYADGPDCANPRVDETNVVGVCGLTVLGIEGEAGAVERLQCDANGSLVSYRYGRDVDPAKTAQRLADCEKNASPTFQYIVFGAWEKNVCKHKYVPRHIDVYTKAEYPCPTPLEGKPCAREGGDCSVDGDCCSCNNSGLPHPASCTVQGRQGKKCVCSPQVIV